MNPRVSSTSAALCLAAALTVAPSIVAAQQAAPTVEELMLRLKEQQQQIERQRQDLERQRAELERQQRQLESLAESIEARQRAASASPAAVGTTPAPAPGGPALSATPAAGAAGAAASATAATPAPTAGSSIISAPVTGAIDPSAARDEGRDRTLRMAGYADFKYQRFDDYPNAQSTTSKKRGRTDMSRFILAPHYNFGGGWSFGSEIEFEHGGTGSTVEFEREEAGEFETEIEKGGEIVLEQLWLQYSHSPRLNFRVGELLVPVGMVNLYHQPTEYFTIDRSIAETSLLPVVWHETGAEMHGILGQARYQMQFVTALDSTGFSGYEFIRGGMQRKMEFRNASAFAFVAAGEYSFAPGVKLGASFYTGDSASNRPRDNLAASARVTLGTLYGRYEVGPWTLRGQALLGRIENAAAITRANLNTFNGGVLGTSRTPIGSRAKSFFVEAGYDLFSIRGRSGAQRLDLFARYDNYDTHAATEGSIVRNGAYARKAMTVGLNYKPRPGIVLKAEYSHRTNDGAVANKQDFLGVGAGFEF